MSKNKDEKTAFATAALVLGIIGVILSFVPIINNLAFVMGILVLLFAIIALVRKKSISVAIVSMILAVAAMGITLVMQKSVGDALDKVSKDVNQAVDNTSGKNTESILKDDLEVNIGEFSVSTDEYGLQKTKLVVSAKNKLNEKKTYSVQIEAVDAEGKRLKEETVYMNDMGAGQSQDFEAFTFIESDKVEALKSAKFKVISATKM